MSATTKEKPVPKTGLPKQLPTKRAKISTVARRCDLAGSDVGIDLNTFGGRLTALRLRDQISQVAVGEHIDRTRQMISQYESGKSFPDLLIVEKLSKFFGVSASYLAFGEHAIKAKKLQPEFAD